MMESLKHSESKEKTVIICDSLFDGHCFNRGLSMVEILGKTINKVERVTTVPDNLDSRYNVVDARGKTVLPSFIDAHAHFLQFGLSTLEVDLSNIKKRSDIFDILRLEIEKNHDQSPIIGKDWDESIWDDTRLPTRKELDQVSKTTPIVIRRVCGHLSVINTPAMVFIPKKHFRGDITEGMALEETVWQIDAQISYSDDLYERAFRNAQQIAYEQGVTTITEITSTEHFRRFQDWMQSGLMQIKMVIYLPVRELFHIQKSGMQSNFGSERLMFGGLKIFTDGSIGAKTAALSKPYNNSKKNKGLLLISRNRLKELIDRADKAKLSLMIHAIGDRAITVVLDAFSRSDQIIGRKLRHRVEHIEVLDEKIIERFEKSGLIGSVQPNFSVRWSQPPDGMNWVRLGPERVHWCDPFSKLFDRDIPLAFGSDCMPFGPLYGLEGAVNHPVSELSISLDQALKAYTYGSAFAGQVERNRGTIEPGKCADIIVLDQNIENRTTLSGVKVNLTMINGSIVYHRS